jgi:hypothetical protein
MMAGLSADVQESRSPLKEVSAEALVSQWVSGFNSVVEAGRIIDVLDFFAIDSWWRDLLALSWDFRSLHGKEAIAGFLEANLGGSGFGRVELDRDYRPQVITHPAGRRWIDALLTFRTALGGGRGTLRLIPSETPAGSEWEAGILLTSFESLDGHEERIRGNRPRGDTHRAESARVTWGERRARETAFEEREPDVVVIGAGHAGLSIAARLGQLGLEALVVERNPRVGDNWRKRYRSLVLHDPVQYDHLPYLPFPETWPRFTPKDKLADWMEAYATLMELNVWTGAEVTSGSRDANSGTWTVTVSKSGVERDLHPAHIVLATGLAGAPVIPDLPTDQSFHGSVLHSSQYVDGKPFVGKRALVVGAANSGFDIARDLWECGAEVTLMQRSSTYVMSLEHGSPTIFGVLYGDDSPPTDQADLLRNLPYLAGTEIARHNAQRIAELDHALLDGLKAAGFHLNQGEQGAGNRLTALRRAGGYVIDVGCGALICAGKVGIKQGVEIARLERDAVVFTDGSEQPADVIVLATGFGNMRETARSIFGDEVADRCDPVWGLDDEGELRTVFRPTGADGLWFTAGGFADCRFYSRHLALQIKARQEGLVDV